MTQIIDATISFEENAEGLLIHQRQEIPHEFLNDLRLKREDSLHTPTGTFAHLCSVPALTAAKWKREGFDIMREPVREIIKRLRKEQLDAFIATNKRV